MYVIILKDGQVKRTASLEGIDWSQVDLENTVLVPGYRFITEEKQTLIAKAHKILRDFVYFYKTANSSATTIWNQGQAMDGTSELHVYRQLVKQVEDLLKSSEG